MFVITHDYPDIITGKTPCRGWMDRTAKKQEFQARNRGIDWIKSGIEFYSHSKDETLILIVQSIESQESAHCN